MVFRRIVFNALLVGVLAGLLLSAAQIIAVNPIIFAAEAYEVPEVQVDDHGHHHAGHDHGHSAQEWAPEDGMQRTLFTVMSNVLAGIGFAAMLLALMSQLQVQGVARLTIAKGLLWGGAGFVAFFVAPGLGLPPEIPGIEAAPVEYRQLWWLLAVAGVGTGLLVLVFAPLKWKAVGVLLMTIPYVVRIPHHQGPAFAHPDPEAVERLAALHQQFIIASGISNVLFWLVLGALCAWALKRSVLRRFEVGAGVGA